MPDREKVIRMLNNTLRHLAGKVSGARCSAGPTTRAAGATPAAVPGRKGGGGTKNGGYAVFTTPGNALFVHKTPDAARQRARAMKVRARNGGPASGKEVR